MTLFAYRSINTKISAIVVTVTALALTVGFTFLLLGGVSNNRKQLQEELTVLARLVGDYAVSPLSFDDAEGAGEVLEKFSQVRSVTESTEAPLTGRRRSLGPGWGILRERSRTDASNVGILRRRRVWTRR